MTSAAAEPGLGRLLARALAATGATGEPHATDERILDGALEEIAASGSVAATMDGIARRAGVGRMTVFRRFGTKEALIERLGLRELQRFLASVDAAVAGLDDPADRIVETFVVCVRAGTEHPFVARQVRDEPGLAFERLTRGDPSPLDIGRAYVAENLRRFAAQGHEIVEETDAAADVLVRLVASYVLEPGRLVDVGDEAAVRAFARRTLAPIVTRRR